MWQHVKLSEQIRHWDTLACCWHVDQPTNQQTNCAVCLLHYRSRSAYRDTRLFGRLSLSRCLCFFHLLCLCLSVSICVCVAASAYVCVCLCLAVFVSFTYCVSVSPSVSVFLLLSLFMFLSVSVSFCLFVWLLNGFLCLFVRLLVCLLSLSQGKNAPAAEQKQ